VPARIPRSHDLLLRLRILTADDWNRVRFDPDDRRGHVESHFLKATSPDANRAFWIKITFLSPKGRPGSAVAEAWAIAFERGKAPVGVKETVAAGAARFGTAPMRLEVPGALFCPPRTSGELRNGARRIAWDLAFEGPGEPYAPFPSMRMYDGPLPRSKLVTPYPDLRFDGVVQVDDVRWEIGGWRGMQGHNWGRSHAARYAWAHCNAFEDAPAGTWLEGFTGQIRIGPLLTPKVTMVGLSLGGSRVRFDDLVGTLRREGSIAYYRWTFRAEQSGHRIEGEARAEHRDLAGLRYENPSGAASSCLNSKLATMEVRYRAPAAQEIRLTSRAAALEIGTHDEDHGVETIL